MTIATRPLGRTGTDVTVLGYGAMELRGADHLRSNLAVAAKGSLPADVYEEAKRRLGQP